MVGEAPAPPLRRGISPVVTGKYPAMTGGVIASPPGKESAMHSTSDPIIGERFFLEGVTKLVYAGRDGQYVLDRHGRPLYSDWVLPDAEPDEFLVVFAPETSCSPRGEGVT
jgi:hypothetical protein